MMLRVCGVLIVGIGLVVTQPGLAAVKQPTRDVPENVAIHDLLEDPDRYDGRRVVVTGFVSSISFEQGRRGSEYAVLILEETMTGTAPTVYVVTVVSLTIPKVRKCQHALVQGVYHREGKQAGRPYEFFVDAEAVLQNDGTESGRVPSGCEEKL